MRNLLFVISVFATAAFGQLYVRSSKGAPLPAFSAYADAGIALASSVVATPVTDNGTQYSWASFETARVRVTGRTGTGYWGQTCAAQVLQYDVQGISTSLRMQLQRSGTGASTTWLLVMTDAARPMTGTDVSTWGTNSAFLPLATTNASMSLSSRFLGCTVDISIVPLPFPTLDVAMSADGGVAVTSTSAPFQCPQTYQMAYLMDAGPIAMGVAPLARYYTVVCNSKDNTSGNIRCRADDAGTVSATVGTVGDVLGVGDCIHYTNPVSLRIYCIGTSVYATTFECAP